MSNELILVIDDSREIVKHLTEHLLPAFGYRSLAAFDGRAGVAMIQRHQPDLVLLDLNLPEMTGLDVLQRLAQLSIRVPVVLMTGYGSEKSAITAFRLGARDYLIKPFTTDEVRETLQRVLSQAQPGAGEAQLTQLRQANAEMSQRLQEMKQLLRIGQALAGPLEMQEVIRRGLAAAVHLTQAEEGVMWLVVGNEMPAFTYTNSQFTEMPALIQPTHAPNLADVLQGKTWRQSAFSGTGILLTEAYAARAILAVPLGETPVLGILAVVNRTTPRSFSEQQQSLLKMLSGFIVGAMQQTRARADQSTQPSTDQTEARTLAELTRGITSSLDLKQVLRQAIHRVHALWDIEASSIWLLNESRRSLRVLASVGVTTGLMSKIEVPLNKGLVGYTVRTGKWIYTNDARNHPLHHPAIDDITGFSTRSLLCVPLVFRQRIIGALELVNKRSAPFHTQDVERAIFIATALAVAVANALLYKQAHSRQRQLAATLEYSTSPIMIIDTRQRVLLLNREARARLDLTSQVVGQPVEQVVHFAELAQFIVQPLTDAGSCQLQIEMPDETVWLCMLGPIPGYGRVLIMQDITTLHHIATIKSDLFTTISHDMRAPLASIIEFASLLRDSGHLPDVQRRYATYIGNASTHMLTMLNDLLDLARINARINQARQLCQVHDTLRDVLADLQGNAILKNITLRLKAAEIIPPISADPMQLRQAIGNLVDNAIKYSPANSEVIIHAYSANGAVLVQVQDKGIGIPHSDMPFIFDRFYRVQTSHSVEGNGLGLAIVRSIAEAHGGQVWVESELGAGSTFTLQLPASTLPPAPDTQTAVPR
ncbi:MAG: GAF domain-containing protein [Anaerolineales bacterium]|nr:GAF domain-containing protein [Anaerolineales bacterium]MCB8951091.1 GAF domain-containing protein [Ardenticatenales bacterium]